MEDIYTATSHSSINTVYYTQHNNNFFNDWCLALPSYIIPPTDNLPKIISIGGGKGGVGKSIISANLATKLSASKKRVVIVDLDIGSSNLHTYLGLSTVKYHLSDYLKNKVSFSSILSPTLNPGIAFIPGDRDVDVLNLINTNPGITTNFWTNLLNIKNTYNVDYLILDLGAGTSQYICDLFSISHLGILTVVPEPSSIENAYSFLKTYFYSLTKNLCLKYQKQDYQRIEDALVSFSPTKSYSYLDFIEDNASSILTQYLKASIRSRTIGIITNQARYSEDTKISEVMEYSLRSYFGFNSKNLGSLNYDESAWKSMRNKKLLTLDSPHSLFSKKLELISNEIYRIFDER